MSSDSPRVLFVEDEETVREAVERALDREGLTVTAFSDYPDPEAVLACAPDLAVLDVLLPAARSLAQHGLAKRNPLEGAGHQVPAFVDRGSERRQIGPWMRVYAVGSAEWELRLVLGVDRGIGPVR